ncbi:hypothetical protein SSYRP_v1c00810 [Spiroplasma syrphidicola EA-1]|uniref:Transmembrane protein n=1 Tax=Spiroplasma syrphidicola EA-1 TaxID=1276229 RepID=R4U2T1_9MOLU|nr:hypothetical protein [Spiroplasma syrphidicola]AGM25677.1 hypothetical protein SSYRP_v1c00810 [Spiroplasma syrphidicola EA-1]
MVKNSTWNWEKTVYEDLSKIMGEGSKEDLKDLNQKMEKAKITKRKSFLWIAILGPVILFYSVSIVWIGGFWFNDLIGQFTFALVISAIIVFIYFAVRYFKAKKQIQKIGIVLKPAMQATREIDFEKHYRNALIEMSSSNYYLIELSRKFHVEPVIGLPKESAISNDNILNVYEKNNDFVYSLGTISLNETVNNIDSSAAITYFNIRLKNLLNITVQLFCGILNIKI